MRKISGQLRVELLSSREAAELFALRLACYRVSRDFEWLDESTLDWTAEDEAAIVLGVRTEDGRLVASNRVTYATSHREAEEHFHYSMADVPARYPALLGTRTCTDSAWARFGLTSLTRYPILQNAQRLGLAAVLAVVYAGAPRVQSMLDAGYECYPIDRHWDQEARILSTPIAVSMPSNHYESALRWVSKTAEELLAVTTFDHDLIRAAFDAAAHRRAFA
ncbi:MAG TPA: hypothetical protein PKA20_23985 [Burkholderiaceae bacterium]|nr:hypothetical protein [Burkholderiaceae bacterium]